MIGKISLHSSRSFSSRGTHVQEDVPRDVEMDEQEQELEQTEHPVNSGPASTPAVGSGTSQLSPVQASTSSSDETGENQVSTHCFVPNTTLIRPVGCYRQPHSVAICD
jgi:hypothetical protein